jgi:hypothetical protein
MDIGEETAWSMRAELQHGKQTRNRMQRPIFILNASVLRTSQQVAKVSQSQLVKASYNDHYNSALCRVRFLEVVGMHATETLSVACCPFSDQKKLFWSLGQSRNISERVL